MEIKISNEVKEALSTNKPVVALESTIITHGMPYPENVKTALEVEKTIRDNDAVPATIAVIDGVPTVGLSPDEIEELGKRTDCVKVSRRDLAVVTAKHQWGGTTVAATMILASFAGIKIFVTGGIGGVHRGAETTMDISADLEELAHTNVNVICAGPKAILDIGLTLEYLETHGVTVVGYQTDELPAFYTRESGFKVDARCDTPLEIADIIRNKEELGLGGGILITNPIPREYSLDKKEIDKVINEAVSSANKEGVKGKELTPYLLAKISEMTEGESLESNIKLILNNAALGAEIAKELTK